MIDQPYEQQMQFLSTYYRLYRLWLCGFSPRYNVDKLILLVHMIENALVMMNKEEGHLLADVYFCGDDEITHEKMVWESMQRSDKIRLMSSFFRCLRK